MNIADTLTYHKRTAERLFCACTLTIPDVIRHDCGWLEPDTFQTDTYRAYWRAVRDGIDPSVAATEQGIYSDLVDALSEIPSSYAYAGFAAAISDDSYYLQIAEILPLLAAAVGERDRARISQYLDDLAKQKPSAGLDVPSAVDVALLFAEAVERDHRAVKTLISPLDAALGGLERQTMTILAARPSMGKTALALQIARNAAAQGDRTLFVSLEMSSVALWARAACGATEVAWRDVLDKKLTQAQLDKLRSEAVNLAGIYGDNLRIDDSPRQTLETIWTKVAKYQPALLVVDHQALVTHPEPSPVKRAGMVAWGLKQIAKEFDCPVLMLQQLNRGVEARDKKRPIMSDLRESGELEEIADNVLFIYRSDYYKEPDKQDVVSDTEIIIAKHRMGGRNSAVLVQYHTRRQWFYAHGELDSPRRSNGRAMYPDVED